MTLLFLYRKCRVSDFCARDELCLLRFCSVCTQKGIKSLYPQEIPSFQSDVKRPSLTSFNYLIVAVLEMSVLAAGLIWSWYEEKLSQWLSSRIIKWTWPRQKAASVLALSNHAALGFCIATRCKTMEFLWMRPEHRNHWYFISCKTILFWINRQLYCKNKLLLLCSYSDSWNWACYLSQCLSYKFSTVSIFIMFF